MGLVHHTASISPTKQELAEAWVPTRTWGAGRAVVEKVAEYRLDDPAGEVGVETILWRLDDDSVCQVPFTYRAAPLEGADAHLIDTMEHSALGRRWIYDGCGDPVWAAGLVHAIRTGGTQSQMFIEQDGRRIDVPPRMVVHGTGAEDVAPAPVVLGHAVEDATSTSVLVDGRPLVLSRILTPGTADEDALIGQVGDDPTTYVLAALARL
jgi:hypothetical protein